jgi:RNA polymerase sigma-70 factor (ECF subfamily)
LPKDELRIDLENAIRELPDGYRTTLVLHDFLGYEHAEVAQLMNVSTGTTKSQLHKARLKVQRLIKRKANPRVTTCFA